MSLSTFPFSDLQQPLISLIKTAGLAVLALFEKNRHAPLTVHFKSDHSPVTEADFTAHRILCKGLQVLTPNVPILSEEGEPVAWAERQTWSQYWLLDPVDGTRQFIQQIGEFTLNVAFIENNKPIIGLLYAPVTDEFYYASTYWGGAYKLDSAGHIDPLQVKPWRLNETAVLISPRAEHPQVSETLGELGYYEIIKLSSAWKFGRLAEGKADISLCLGDTSEWDTAAGQCIVELAGGSVLDLKGHPLRYNMRDSPVNPQFVALGDQEKLFPFIFGESQN